MALLVALIGVNGINVTLLVALVRVDRIDVALVLHFVGIVDRCLRASSHTGGRNCYSLSRVDVEADAGEAEKGDGELHFWSLAESELMSKLVSRWTRRWFGEELL